MFEVTSNSCLKLLLLNFKVASNLYFKSLSTALLCLKRKFSIISSCENIVTVMTTLTAKGPATIGVIL